MTEAEREAPDLERRSAARALAERILVLTPTGDDAALIKRILEERDFSVAVLDRLEDLVRELSDGAGVALIAVEALAEGAAVASFKESLDTQEPWSELPVLLFGANFENPAAGPTDLLGSRAQLVLLERPIGIAGLVTATDAALRSRRRQYEVKRLLDQLEQSAVEVTRAHDEATRAKDEFLATLGHELRSPIMAIRGWIEMLKSGNLEEEEASSALAMIEASTKVQSHIVEDLMDVSKILAGKVMIEPEVVALGPLVENIVATFSASAASEGILLSSEIPSEPVFAFVDPSRLQQVGWNLVSNAIKFTPHGGEVHVALAAEEGEAVIRVRDTGQGMEPELLMHVFDRYRQGKGVAKRQRGLGLGLSIVRHLVESHGGRVIALSEGLGKGSEFILSLPLADPPTG